MDYVVIKGFHSGMLLYVPSEKHLYVRKSSRNGTVYLTCYDTIISKNDINNEVFCSARCHLQQNTCVRTEAPHTNHENHEMIYKDLVSLNAMKDTCRLLAEWFPISAKNIPIKEIFLMEMAKYVKPICFRTSNLAINISKVI